MRRYRFLTLIFLLPFFSLSAQDISGLWQGVSYITNTTRYYVCTMTLQQNGTNVTGTALTKEVARGYYAVQSVAGTVNNNIFKFSDQTLLYRYDSIGFDWCSRLGDLTCAPSVEKLSVW